MISYTCRGYDFEVNQFANIDSIVDIVRKMQLKIQKKERLGKIWNLELTTENYVSHYSGI